MNPLKLVSQFLAMTQEQHDAVIKFCIAVTFCFTVVIMVGVSLYSVVFVTQPMNGMAPADKQFFLILSDMSKYILGSLATLLAVKGKDAIAPFVPPGLSTAAEREDKPKSPAPIQPTIKRQEPVLETVAYNPKEKPEQPPHPEIT
jgi:hypothetical protein